MRIKNINLIKSIAIFLVVVIHFGPILYEYNNQVLNYNFFLVYRSILSIAVPLLLIVSGYLIINKEYTIKQLLNRVLHIFLLIIIYKLIYSLAFKYELPSFSNFIYSLTTTSTIGYRSNSLWYMYALIGIYLLMPFISYIVKNKKLYNYLLILVLIYPFIFKSFELLFNASHEYNIQLSQTLYPFQTHYLFALGFFLVGGWIKLNEDKIIKKFRTSYLLIVTIISLILQSVYSLIITNQTSTLFDPMYDGYSTIFCLVSSTSIFYILRYNLKEIDNKLIDFISANTFGIYLLHWPITYYLKQDVINNVIINSYIDNLIISIVVFVICLLLSYFLKKTKLTSLLVKL